MKDLRPDLAGLWQSVTRTTSSGTGRVILFIAAEPGSGTTSMAASFALMAAARAQKTAWLVDLDLRRNPAFAGFQAGFANGVKRPGRAYDASLGTAPIYMVSAPPGTATGARGSNDKRLCAHRIEGTRLLVTRFRTEGLVPGQRIRLRSQPDWWLALRRASDWAVVDAPALKRSGAGLAVAAQADGVVLVARADRTPARAVARLRDEIEAHGGTLVGVAMNRMRADARLADRFSL